MCVFQRGRNAGVSVTAQGLSTNSSQLWQAAEMTPIARQTSGWISQSLQPRKLSSRCTSEIARNVQTSQDKSSTTKRCGQSCCMPSARMTITVRVASNSPMANQMEAIHTQEGSFLMPKAYPIALGLKSEMQRMAEMAQPAVCLPSLPKHRVGPKETCHEKTRLRPIAIFLRRRRSTAGFSRRLSRMDPSHKRDGYELQPDFDEDGPSHVRQCLCRALGLSRLPRNRDMAGKNPAGAGRPRRKDRGLDQQSRPLSKRQADGGRSPYERREFARRLGVLRLWRRY